jgi:Protein of unknown function (DUF5656)
MDLNLVKVRRVQMASKRQKVVVTSLVGGALVFVAMMTSLTSGFFEMGVVLVVVYLLSIWALRPGLSSEEHLTLLALPIILTAGVVLLVELPNLLIPWKYFLPPIFSAGLYVTLLAENVFHVSYDRSIPLLRAARTVGYLLTLGSVFLFSSVIFSFHFPAFLNSLIMLVVGGAAVGQALWHVELARTSMRLLVLASTIAALTVGEVAAVISFWPAAPLLSGLVMTTVTYFLIGIVQHSWQENLDRRTVVEYVLLGSVMIVVLLLGTSWGG